jgi:hypothetical protein
MTALLLSIVSAGLSQVNPTQKASAQISSAANPACQILPIAGVTASGNDGNVPRNVLDNNLNTRWSNLGVGSFIQADLGGQKTICSVDIAWYRGNLRHNNFVISVSSDGTSFTSVFSGTGSGTTLSAEKYSLPTSATARFVRVTVNGNTENNWASIAELSVDGLSNTPPQNNPPTADSKTISTNAGTSEPITLTGTDPIPGDVLKFSVIANPQHGTLTNPTSNSVTYTPNAGFSGTDSFTYKATTKNGQAGGVDSNIATVNIVVSNATSGTLDQFGIKELYPSKTGAEHWNMNMQSEGNDPQFSPNGVTLFKNADTTYKVMSSQVRLQIFPSTGFQENQIVSLNQAQLAAQGYMLRLNDWKNVEMTGYLKANSVTGSSQNGAAHIEFVARGARNTNDQFAVGGFPAMCEATTYHSNTYLSPQGRVKFEKDLMHTAGYTANSQDPQRLNSVNIALGKWVGIKAVYYNFPNGTVKLEQWVDDSTANVNAPGNNWHKVLEFVDHGQWGGGHPNCGGTDHTIITWGGPIALFRWDNVDNMDIKNLSIREIQPPQ